MIRKKLNLFLRIIPNVFVKMSYSAIILSVPEEKAVDESIIEYYTIMAVGSAEKNTNRVCLSSTEGIFNGRLIYSELIDGYLTVTDVDYNSNIVTLDGKIPRSGSNVVFTLRNYDDNE